MDTVPDGIPCFGDTCQTGAEFCDSPSRFCISCSATPWKDYCFTPKHIANCTAFCQALELKNRPPSVTEPGAYEMPPWLVPVIALLLVIAIAVACIVGFLFRKYLVRIKTVLPCFVDHNETNEIQSNPADNLDDEAEEGLTEPQTTGDPHPVQVTEEEATTSNGYPTFGPTALKNHEETKLI